MKGDLWRQAQQALGGCLPCAGLGSEGRWGGCTTRAEAGDGITVSWDLETPRSRRLLREIACARRWVVGPGNVLEQGGVAGVQPRLIQGVRSGDGIGEDQDTITSIRY